MRSPVGVTVIAGFLGAGKTTLVRRMVGDPVIGARLAVLVNELGTLGLDEELIAAAKSTANLKTVQLSSGCLCCTLSGELPGALAELVQSGAQHIVLEASGAALASELRYRVSMAALEVPVRAEAVVTLVDAVHAERSAREHAHLFEDQLRAADLVVLSKMDLAANPEGVRAWLAARTQTQCVEAVRGDLDVAQLLGLSSDTPAPGPHGAHAFRSETVALPSPVARELLEDALEDAAHDAFRIKGLVDVKDAGPVEVQVVGDLVELTPLPAATGPRRLIVIAASDPGAPAARLRATLSG
jgi:G3E family GTPase